MFDPLFCADYDPTGNSQLVTYSLQCSGVAGADCIFGNQGTIGGTVKVHGFRHAAGTGKGGKSVIIGSIVRYLPEGSVK